MADLPTISNAQVFDFLASNIPLFECPGSIIEEIYYVRWRIQRKQIGETFGEYPSYLLF